MAPQPIFITATAQIYSLLIGLCMDPEFFSHSQAFIFSLLQPEWHV